MKKTKKTTINRDASGVKTPNGDVFPDGCRVWPLDEDVYSAVSAEFFVLEAPSTLCASKKPKGIHAAFLPVGLGVDGDERWWYRLDDVVRAAGLRPRRKQSLGGVCADDACLFFLPDDFCSEEEKVGAAPVLYVNRAGMESVTYRTTRRAGRLLRLWLSSRADSPLFRPRPLTMERARTDDAVGEQLLAQSKALLEQSRRLVAHERQTSFALDGLKELYQGCDRRLSALEAEASKNNVSPGPVVQEERDRDLWSEPDLVEEETAGAVKPTNGLPDPSLLLEEEDDSEVSVENDKPSETTRAGIRRYLLRWVMSRLPEGVPDIDKDAAIRSKWKELYARFKQVHGVDLEGWARQERRSTKSGKPLPMDIACRLGRLEHLRECLYEVCSPGAPAFVSARVVPTLSPTQKQAPKRPRKVEEETEAVTSCV